MVIAETALILAGVKAAVAGTKEVINTCKDIGEIAHHIDAVFNGHEEITKQVKEKSPPPPNKFQAFVNSRLGNAPEPVGNGTSIQEVTAFVLQQKQIEKEMHNMMIMINKRFGHKTWSEILALRKQRIIERDKENIRRKEAAKKKAKAEAIKWEKYAKEFGKFIVIIAVGIGMYFYISWACKGCI
tara:strand:+ start:231 stop:785 length:555 start_codon:yes stop_codon:yes gene_type:complete